MESCQSLNIETLLEKHILNYTSELGGIEEEGDWVKNEEDTLKLLGVKVRNTHAVVLSFGNKVQH